MACLIMKGKKVIQLTKVVMMHGEIPAGWMELMGLRKAPHFVSSDGNRLDSDISHFKLVQGASLPDFRCSLTVMTYNSR